MKKTNIIALSVLAIGMASCSSDNEEQGAKTVTPQAIEIATYFGENTNTRATHISNDGTTGYSFKDTGFKVYANVVEQSTGKVTPLMNDQAVNWDAGVSAWKYAPIKYWPTDGSKVDFYPRYEGWGENAANIRTTYDWNNIPQVTFYVNDVVSKQTDYIWAAPILGAKNTDYSSTNPAVKFNFKHALSAFTFTLKVDGASTGFEENVTRIKVNAVTLTGYFAPKATLNPRETDIKKIWNLQGDWEKRSYTISRDGDKEIWASAEYGLTEKFITWRGNTKNAAGDLGKGTIMVLPFDNTSYSITLDYDVITYPSAADKAANTNGVKQNYKASREVTNVALEPGKIYKNDIVLTLNAIVVDAIVSEWE